MLKDKKFIWILEYLIGLGLLVVIMPFLVRPHPIWSDAHGWAYLLFITCSGIILVSSAGSMRQRMRLAKRIEQLEQMVNNPKPAPKQAQSEAGQKRTASEYFVGSVN